jgi:hypothetical protein
MDVYIEASTPTGAVQHSKAETGHGL